MLFACSNRIPTNMPPDGCELVSLWPTMTNGDCSFDVVL